MKVFLDDQRVAPEGWTPVRWPEEAIALLETGEVDAISLDHDLGDDARTGYDVLTWIEEAVATRGFVPPTITIHSANAGARPRMALAVESIRRLADQRQADVKAPSAAKRDVFEKRYARLLARRVPIDAIVLGRAYVIHARNGGIGVAERQDGMLGYCLHREKWGEHYLFTEYDWAEGPPFGTAIPLRALDGEPPKDQEQLLAWLAEREAEHEDEIQAAWKVILGDLFPADGAPSKG